MPGAGADLAELVADPLRGPGGFDGVGVAQVQQGAVGHAAHVGAVDGAEGGEGLVPGGAGVGGGRGGFGSDRLGGVVVAGQLAPGADGAGPALPVQPVQRVAGDRAEGGDGPGRGVLGGVLADPVLAGVHQRGDLRGVRAAFGVGDGRELPGPRAGRERDQGAEAVAEAGVDDAGDVAGAGQVPLADRGGQDLPGVQPGEFGGAQGAPQPFRLVAGLAAVAGREGVHEQVLVPLVAGRGGLGGPDRVQQGQVVRVGQGLVPDLGGGQQLAVTLQHAGQHGEGLPRCRRWGGLVAGSGGEAVVAGELGGRARAGDRVGEFRGQREHVREVDVGAAGQGDVGVLAVLGRR